MDQWEEYSLNWSLWLIQFRVCLGFKEKTQSKNYTFIVNNLEPQQSM